MQGKNLFVPIVGDFAGPKAIRKVADYLKQRNAIVSAFYVSNVEVYLGAILAAVETRKSKTLRLCLWIPQVCSSGSWAWVTQPTCDGGGEAGSPPYLLLAYLSSRIKAGDKLS